MLREGFLVDLVFIWFVFCGLIGVRDQLVVSLFLERRVIEIGQEGKLIVDLVFFYFCLVKWNFLGLVVVWV